MVLFFSPFPVILLAVSAWPCSSKYCIYNYYDSEILTTRMPWFGIFSETVLFLDFFCGDGFFSLLQLLTTKESCFFLLICRDMTLKRYS
jgi:hypothetical protein